MSFSAIFHLCISKRATVRNSGMVAQGLKESFQIPLRRSSLLDAYGSMKPVLSRLCWQQFQPAPGTSQQQSPPPAPAELRCGRSQEPHCLRWVPTSSLPAGQASHLCCLPISNTGPAPKLSDPGSESVGISSGRIVSSERAPTEFTAGAEHSSLLSVWHTPVIQDMLEFW